MDQSLRDFQEAGLADAVQAWDHRVTITTSADTVTPVTTVILQGVQSDVEVDPGQLERFGFKVKRVFSLFVAGPAIVVSIKPGMRAVEENGEPGRFLWYKRDRLGVLFYFGSVNQ